MTARGFAGRWATGAPAVLASLALLVQALMPAGYMIAASPARGPAMVICTGHGPLTLTDRSAHKAPVQKKAAGVCAFAGHGAPPLPEAARPLMEIRWSGTAAAIAGRQSVFVGRGLAAPPPARGPPTLLV